MAFGKKKREAHSDRNQDVEPLSFLSVDDERKGGIRYGKIDIGTIGIYEDNVVALKRGMD